MLFEATKSGNSASFRYLVASSTCFVVHQSTVAKDLPMGDTFTTEVRFCITQERKSEANAAQESPKTPTSANSPKHARASTVAEGSPRTPGTPNLSDSPQTSKLSNGSTHSRRKSSPSMLVLSKESSPEQDSLGVTSSEQVNEAESQSPNGEASSKRIETPGKEANPSDGPSSKSIKSDGGGTAVTRLQISYEPKFHKSTIMKVGTWLFLFFLLLFWIEVPGRPQQMCLQWSEPLRSKDRQRDCCHIFSLKNLIVHLFEYV